MAFGDKPSLHLLLLKRLGPSLSLHEHFLLRSKMSGKAMVLTSANVIYVRMFIYKCWECFNTPNATELFYFALGLSTL
jgi:hypothetical protein